MLSTRLVELMEAHSEEIANSVLDQVRKDRRLPLLGKLPDQKLLVRFGDVCKRLGYWLSESNEAALIEHYESLGRMRYLEGIPLDEVVWAAFLVKQQLLRYARDHCYEQTAYEIYTEAELERLVNGFFDKLVYHIVRGYQSELGSEPTGELWQVAATSR